MITADIATVDTPQTGRDWVRILAHYRNPSQLRSIIELLITLVPFALMMALAWWSLSISYTLAAVISTLNGAFLVRLFVIQHDCGHRSFFRSRQTNDWTGRVLGVLTMPPPKTCGGKNIRSIMHRLGTSAETTRGFGEAEFRNVGTLILKVIDALSQNPDGDASLEAEVMAEVKKMCADHPIYDQ